MAKNAKAFIEQLDQAPVVQAIMNDPNQVSAIRAYVDDLRKNFPGVSDSDLGWIVQWVSGFIMNASIQHGIGATPDRMMMTFAVMSRELLLLEAAPVTPDDNNT